MEQLTSCNSVSGLRKENAMKESLKEQVELKICEHIRDAGLPDTLPGLLVASAFIEELEDNVIELTKLLYDVYDDTMGDRVGAAGGTVPPAKMRERWAKFAGYHDEWAEIGARSLCLAADYVQEALGMSWKVLLVKSTLNCTLEECDVEVLSTCWSFTQAKSLAQPHFMAQLKKLHKHERLLRQDNRFSEAYYKNTAFKNLQEENGQVFIQGPMGGLYQCGGGTKIGEWKRLSYM